MALHNRVKVEGILCREYHPPLQPFKARDIQVRLADKKDVSYIAEINEEVFDHYDEITEVINKERMFLFEQNQILVGFGIFQPIVPGRPEYDIGMLVTKPFRKKGYATYILRYLTQYCHTNGYRPTCGCAVENIASRRSLENAGFIARYRLLQIYF